MPKTWLPVRYTDSVAKNGGIPMIVPFTQDMDLLRESLKFCGGVIIPGGGDADPRLYGEEPHEKLGEINREMDDMQLTALRYLLDNNIPTLGVCRGCQMMNILTGGKLWQDLSEMPAQSLHHGEIDVSKRQLHKVTVTPQSRLHKLLGTTNICTNSHHHQAVKTPGKGFTATARTADGVIEAIEHENGVWLGVQWHPERMTGSVPEMNALFRDLVENASK